MITVLASEVAQVIQAAASAATDAASAHTPIEARERLRAQAANETPPRLPTRHSGEQPPSNILVSGGDAC
jgi:hypothetical protein